MSRIQSRLTAAVDLSDRSVALPPGCAALAVAGGGGPAVAGCRAGPEDWDEAADFRAAIESFTTKEADLYREFLVARRSAGEPEHGIRWRALCDVRQEAGHWAATGVTPPVTWTRGLCRRDSK